MGKNHLSTTKGSPNIGKSGYHLQIDLLPFKTIFL